MRIRQKLIIITIVLSVVPLLFITALSYKNAHDDIEKEICAKLEVSRKLKADKIETFFRDCMNDLVVQQNRYEIKSSIPIMERRHQHLSDSSYQEAKHNLDYQFGLLLSVKPYIDAMLLDSDGHIIYVSEPRFESARLDKPLPGTDPDLFEKSQKENQIGGIYSTGFPDHPLGKLLIGAVTDSRNRFIGAIALSVDMQYVYRFLEDRTGLGETGETLIVQKTGNDRMLFISPLRHDPQALLKKKIKIGSSDATAAQDAVMGGNGIGRRIDYRGVPTLASWQYLPSLNWGLIVKIDIEEALAPVYRLRKLIYLLTLITIIFVILASLGTAKIIADPIHELHRGVDILGRGNLDYKVGRPARDEIGQLSRAFDDMVENIKNITSSRDELEEANQKLKSEMAERLRAEEALRQSERNYREIFNSISEAIFIHDAETGAILDVNQSMLNMYGYSRDEALRLGMADISQGEPPYSQAEAGQNVRKAVDEGPQLFEWIARRRSGETFWVEVALRSSEIGGRGRVLAVVRDITEHRQLERVIAENEARYRLLAENATDIIWTVDMNMRPTYMSPAITRLTGYAIEEAMRRTMQEAYTPHSFDLAQKSFAETMALEQAGRLAPHESRILELELNRKDGATVPVETNFTFLRDAGGRPTGILAIARDITERKRVEEALRETNAYLDNLFNYANAPIIVWDPQFRITRFNHAFEALTGRSAAEVIGRPLDILFPPAQVSSSMELIRRTQTGERWEAIEIGILQCTGGIRTVLWNSATLFAPDGKTPEATIAQGQDITERKGVEHELDEMVKELAHSNAELEQFAFVASHDLKSPLRAIESLASWIEEDLAGALTDSSRQHIDLLRQRVRRMERLLNDLLDYSRIGRVSHEVHEIDTAELIRQTRDLLNIPEGFQVEIRSSMPILRTQATPLRQVFQNIIGNAVKHHDRNEGMVAVSSADQGEFVEFRVSDDGPGIPREFHNRVFGMFQTLKSRDEVEGSGIGLAVVKKIIEQFGGTIAIESDEPRGITFRFTWPKTMKD